MLHLCRLCATNTLDTKRLNIFDDVAKSKNLLLKIVSCIGLNVLETDSYPKVLCCNCVTKLETYHEFKINCHNTDLYFKENFHEPFLEKFPSSSTCNTESGLTLTQLENIHASTTKVESTSQDVSGRGIGYDPTLIGGDFSPSSELLVFRCHYCKADFPTRKESLAHVKLKHQKTHKCNVCNRVFRSIKLLSKHREKHADIKQDKRMDSNNKCNISNRLKSNAVKKFICKVCGKEYGRKYELELHERGHSGDKPFSCTYCSQRFISTSARNKHIQVHEKRWSHVCSYCGKGFVNKTKFVCHVQKNHTCEFSFPCSKCEKKFVRKQDLMKHDSNMHSTKPRACYKCNICSKTYTSISYLTQHKKIHEISLENRKKFKCNICDAAFLTKNSLKHHIFVHTGELPYECEICKKRYNRKLGLKIHLLIHSGVKKFVCEVCGKAFALKNSLECHSRTHTGERPFQCNVCHQQFTQKSTLNTHRKRHVAEETPTQWQS